MLTRTLNIENEKKKKKRHHFDNGLPGYAKITCRHDWHLSAEFFFLFIWVPAARVSRVSLAHRNYCYSKKDINFVSHHIRFRVCVCRCRCSFQVFILFLLTEFSEIRESSTDSAATRMDYLLLASLSSFLFFPHIIRSLVVINILRINWLPRPAFTIVHIYSGYSQFRARDRQTIRHQMCERCVHMCVQLNGNSDRTNVKIILKFRLWSCVSRLGYFWMCSHIERRHFSGSMSHQ